VVEHLASSIAGLLLCVVAGTAAYGGLLLLCGGLNPRDRLRLTEIIAWSRARREQGGSQGWPLPSDERTDEDIDVQGSCQPVDPLGLADAAKDDPQEASVH
jgi:hypothetical protein